MRIYTLTLKKIFFGSPGSSLLQELFSSCGERGLLSVAMLRLPIAVASLIVEHRLLGPRASVVAARGLSSRGSRALEHRLSSCDAHGLVASQHVGSSGIGDRTHVSALAGRFFFFFLTTEPLGKPYTLAFNHTFFHCKDTPCLIKKYKFLGHKRNHCSEEPAHHSSRVSPLAATRESPKMLPMGAWSWLHHTVSE